MISRTEIPDFKKKLDVVSLYINCGQETLLLLRQDHKPQGNTWAMLAGKVKTGESQLDALMRETDEEIGIKFNEKELKYFESYYVRYPEFDYMYHVYSITLSEKPVLNLNLEEHKDYCWITPTEALKLNLIQDEDSCIKWFFKI